MQQVAITGYGFQSAVGSDWSYFSHANCKKPQLSTVSTTNETSVPIYPVSDFYFDRSKLKHKFDRLDSVNKLALICCERALRIAGLTDEQSYVVNQPRVDVIFASTYSGSDTLLNNMEIFYAKGSRYLTPLMWSCGIYSSLSVICQEYGLKGYNSCVGSDMAAGYAALQVAFDRIQTGNSNIVLVFGIDPINRFVADNQVMFQNNADKNSGIPFSPASNGFVLGEACGALVLENVLSAEKRHAPILGYIQQTGFCRRSNNSSENNSIYQAILNAVGKSQPVHFVYSGANGSPKFDALEKEGLEMYFRNKSPLGPIPVAPMKYFWGETLGSAGILSVIASLHTLNCNFWPKANELRSIDWKPLHLDENWNKKSGVVCGSDMFGNGYALLINKSSDDKAEGWCEID